MTTQALNYLEAIERLSTGATLILTDVSWEEYQRLLTDLGDSYAVRVSYDKGRLEIVSPSLKHEKYKDVISALARLLADETGLTLESCGSATFQEEQLDKAAEPDTCFYVENAARIIGKDRIDLSVDPPPDIVVEIDVSHESKRKLSFYAALGVPEVWRYDGRRVRIYHLTGNQYFETPASAAFQVLTSDALTSFVEQSKTAGQSATLRSFREWLRIQRQQEP
jgi:Uma2 family endonuclease